MQRSEAVSLDVGPAVDSPPAVAFPQEGERFRKAAPAHENHRAGGHPQNGDEAPGAVKAPATSFDGGDAAEDLLRVY